MPGREDACMGSLIMAGLVATALCNQIEMSRPDVGPLEPRFRVDGEMRPDGTCKTGIYLADPLLIGHWVVLSFGKVREGFGMGGWGGGSVERKKSKPSPSAVRAQIGYAGSDGLIACDLETGRAIELIPPRPNRNPDHIISVIHHYRWSDDRCAVVMEQLQKNGPETGKVLGTDLWEWSLGTNSLKPIGNWDAAALLKLVLDPRLVDATLVKSDPQGGQTVELRDQETGRSTRIALQGPRALEPTGGGSTAVFGDEMTIIPQSDRRSFVIYCSGLSLPEERQNEPRFFCVDPRSPGGRRWVLSPADLKLATGTEHSWIFPIGGLSLESGLIAIGLTDSVSGPDHLVIAEGATGRIRRVVAVPKKDHDDDRQDWVVSPDGSTVAFVADPHSIKYSRALVTIDMKTGRVAPRFDPVDHFRYFNDLFAIDRRGRILMLLRNQVERVTLDESLSSEGLFHLNPPALRHDTPITAAGIRRLGDLPSLTSLALSRMEVTGDMLRELAKLRGLTRLSLIGDCVGDLTGLGALSQLRSLTVGGKMWDRSHYREVARLRNLQDLDVQPGGWRLPVGALDELANLTSLVSLRLTGVFADDLSLKPLQALKNLKSFEFAFPSLNDANLGVLSGLSQLERLSIYTNGSNASGEGIKKLGLLPELSDLALSLNGNSNFDSIVSALAACRHLRRLRLADNNELSAGVLPKLGQLPELTELDLHMFGIENGEKPIEGLAQCKNLTRLRLTDYSLKPGDVEEILKLKNLQLFDHSQTWDAAIGLPGIFGLKTLEEFDAFTPQYRSPALTDEGLMGLEGLSNLKTLQLSGNAITDAGLTRIAPLTQLVRLKLAHTYVTDRGLATLKPLSRLADLDLFDTEISDAGLKELGDFGGLQALDLGMTQITDAGLKYLARLRELRRLNLEGNSITDAGLRQLVAVQSLEDLDLAGTAITNAGLKELQSLKNLRRLVLKRTAITDAGLGDLKALPHLSSLSLGR
jgi:internalin A